MVNRQESIPRLIFSLPIRQRVFVGLLFLLALIVSVITVCYVDPATAAMHRGSVDPQPLASLGSVVLG
jgi:hypothetical protein